MKRISGIFLATLIAVTIFTGISPVHSTQWETGFPMQVTYEELDGGNYGEVSVTLSMVLPAGTPLLAREAAVASALSALQDIWDISSVHEDVRGFLGPVIPTDVQNAVSHINGTTFITDLMDTFEMVSDAGFSRFQIDTEVTVTELITVPRRLVSEGYPDAPRFFAWIVGEGWTENERDKENWVVASLINFSASVLSFRSEEGRFPYVLTEIVENGHLLIEPLNPYTGEPVYVVDYVSPGDIAYEYIDPDNVVLMTYLSIGNNTEIIRREINVPTGSSFDLLYRQSAGLSDTDMTIARYTFQLAQILNEYYYSFGDLPYRVPQCEAEGFAYVSFVNPYTSIDAQMANNFSPQEGDYYYQRISMSEYFLIGYGESGMAILTITKDFTASQVEMGTLLTQ